MSAWPISKLRAADDERRQTNRNSLAGKLTVEAKTIVDLKIEKAAVSGERRTVEADLGPVKYLATQLGLTDEVVLRWFILVAALLLDPAAVLLLLVRRGAKVEHGGGPVGSTAARTNRHLKGLHGRWHLSDRHLPRRSRRCQEVD